MPGPGTTWKYIPSAREENDQPDRTGDNNFFPDSGDLHLHASASKGCVPERTGNLLRDMPPVVHHMAPVIRFGGFGESGIRSLIFVVQPKYIFSIENIEIV